MSPDRQALLSLYHDDATALSNAPNPRVTAATTATDGASCSGLNPGVGYRSGASPKFNAHRSPTLRLTAGKYARPGAKRGTFSSAVPRSMPFLLYDPEPPPFC